MEIKLMNKQQENNLPTTLVIMAAGIGSRFGGGIKQLEPVGPSGEIIMDYSIYDAFEAGFNKVVFIIRKDIEKDFVEIIGNRIEKILGAENVEYVFQQLDNLPNCSKKEELLMNRTKPWGTGQAVLACRGVVNTPFIVINADDYYGKEAFLKVHDYLVENYNSQFEYCMAGFILRNTLSENGGVTRGLCQVSSEKYLTDIVETKNIIKTLTGAEADGKAIDLDSFVSMNMWGLTPEFIDVLETGFVKFLEATDPMDKGAEYLLPTIIGGMIKENTAKVKLLKTSDEWFGVTYKEDKQFVKDSFIKLIEKGTYSKNLFGTIE